MTPRLHWPNPIVTSAVLFVLSVFSGVAFLLSLVATGQTHEQAITQTLHEVNGNKAMIFAVCRGFRRRDDFEQKRLEAAKELEFRYQRMTKPFSPIVKNYFHERRQLILKNVAIQKKQFVDFDCIKGMERAYFEGYRAPVSPTPIMPIVPSFFPTGAQGGVSPRPYASHAHS